MMRSSAGKKRRILVFIVKKLPYHVAVVEMERAIAIAVEGRERPGERWGADPGIPLEDGIMKKLILATLVVMVATPVVALADGPINLALVPSIQIVGEDQSVSAFRLSIWGRNVNHVGLDWGIITQNTGSVTGVQWAAVGLVGGDFTGWQGNWLASVTNGNMQGLQVGAYTHSGAGSSGVQWGLFNTADDFSGLQVGFVNVTEVMRSGLQIGLVNIIKSKEKLKFFPIVNWSF
jgi:hypothetical protein